ncbi:hypothetical protein [Streptomyces sp. SHP 1-2]|uniref:hypothetical protein n=1 Tax=Streptomyces sp. SHP 1-2 TaxID=2769489 RepID=UPI002238C7F3|nr:hypothetical protein [Streptomyces sp. SHP 1-2]MCW5250069.1 hypothetical protein [Streptomyces sp. SHP 1-2]
MSPGQEPRLTDASSYRSADCRIGAHLVCAESSPETAPVGLPVIYEACDCPCHSTVGPAVRAEVAL